MEISFANISSQPADAKQAEGRAAPDRAKMMEVYEQFARPVYNFFYYSLTDRETAEDLTGDVFVKILNKSGFYDPDKGEIKTWIFTVARNTLRDYLRTVKRAPGKVPLEKAAEMAATAAGPEETAIRGSEAAALVTALRRLNKRERNLVALKYGAGLRNKEIAELSSLSERHVGVILSRTLSKLKKMLGDDFI